MALPTPVLSDGDIVEVRGSSDDVLRYMDDRWIEGRKGLRGLGLENSRKFR